MTNYIDTDMVNAIRPDVLEKIVASDDGGYTTGADFAVNGGLHMG